MAAAAAAAAAAALTPAMHSRTICGSCAPAQQLLMELLLLIDYTLQCQTPPSVCAQLHDLGACFLFKWATATAAAETPMYQLHNCRWLPYHHTLTVENAAACASSGWLFCCSMEKSCISPRASCGLQEAHQACKSSTKDVKGLSKYRLAALDRLGLRTLQTQAQYVQADGT
jgi:hypothetical protein